MLFGATRLKIIYPYILFFRYDDKSALEKNTAVLSALKDERLAQMQGKTSGRIHNATNSYSRPPNLPPHLLDWLANGGEQFTTADNNNTAEKGMLTVSGARTVQLFFYTLQ